ncbi:MAG: NifB/NifX family molybdenum-iron cluster-binding protein [Candidatus Methylumidiphilus sp.]
MALIRRMRIVDKSEEELAMATSLTIAFCTDDMKTVNQHFGSAKTFAIYAVDLEQSTLLEVAEFGKLDQDGNEDKLATKIGLLDGCAAVYCEAVGASAIHQLMAAGIQPVKVYRGSQITDLITDFQAELRSGPSAWVAKALARQGGSADKFGEMEADGWDE